jgi:hypothetical protein
LSKGDFDDAMALIIDCRKKGLLPLDFVGEDAARASIHVEQLDAADPEAQARGVVKYVNTADKGYDPLSLWELQDNYVEMWSRRSA